MAISDYITSTTDWINETTRHLFEIDGTNYFIDDVCGTLKLLSVSRVAQTNEWVGRPDNTPTIRRRGVELDMFNSKNAAIRMRCIETLVNLGFCHANANTHKKQTEQLWEKTRG